MLRYALSLGLPPASLHSGEYKVGNEGLVADACSPRPRTHGSEVCTRCHTSQRRVR